MEYQMTNVQCKRSDTFLKSATSFTLHIGWFNKKSNSNFTARGDQPTFKAGSIIQFRL
jgi:hypothetical protein